MNGIGIHVLCSPETSPQKIYRLQAFLSLDLQCRNDISEVVDRHFEIEKVHCFQAIPAPGAGIA